MGLLTFGCLYHRWLFNEGSRSGHIVRHRSVLLHVLTRALAFSNISSMRRPAASTIARLPTVEPAIILVLSLLLLYWFHRLWN